MRQTSAFTAHAGNSSCNEDSLQCIACRRYYLISERTVDSCCSDRPALEALPPMKPAFATEEEDELPPLARATAEAPGARSSPVRLPAELGLCEADVFAASVALFACLTSPRPVAGATTGPVGATRNAPRLILIPPATAPEAAPWLAFTGPTAILLLLLLVMSPADPAS